MKECHMETFRGIYFSLTRPDPKDVNAEDVAHGLAHTCRFGGHVKRFYSVAEHCCHIADWVVERTPPFTTATAAECLVHDAAEAYVGDVVKGVKDLMPAFDLLEAKVMTAVREAWGMGGNDIFGHVTKELDRRILVDEAKALCRSGGDWRALEGVQGLGVDIQCWPPEQAKQAYLMRLTDLVPEAR